MSTPILCVITARGGSKGVPGKNIKLLGGKPLIAWSIEAAKKSDLITHTVVSTDDPEIMRVAQAWGGEVPFQRPAELATDTARHLDVMQHATDFMEKKLGMRFAYVVIFQPTSPFRTKEDIDGTLQKLLDTNADTAVSIVEVPANFHPALLRRLEGDRVYPFLPEFPLGTVRKQDLPTYYRQSSAVYAMRRDLLMEEGKLYGEKVVGYVTPTERFIDIDTPADWALAEWMLQQQK